MKMHVDLSDSEFFGEYNADKEYWDIYIDPCITANIPTELYIRADKHNPYWSCYLHKAQYCKKVNKYHLIYKEY